MTKTEDKILKFCLIQLQIINDKEQRLRKDLLDCKIQKEFLNSIIDEIKSVDD
tara:strand:- start:536 stop:694 length:159 start_codon:yes stop_codon:yes gene_type:complete